MLAAPTPELAPGHPVRSLALRGRVVRYLDTGEPDRHAVVFFGGIGTSAAAFMLTELPRPPSPVAGASSPSTHTRGAGPRPGNERDRLGLRFISVERNGFGATPFHPALGFPEAIDDVLAVLATLGVQRFSVVAISGGGPYAARLLARVPERVASVHLAAATSGGALVTHGAAAGLLGDIEAVVNDPAAFWEYPPDSPVHAIPGFMDAARHEGRRALAEPTRAAAALRHEIALLGSEDLPVLRGLPAPAFLYWGADDALVPIVHARAWQASLGVVAATRIYPGEGHDVQYVHWPEILGDIAAAVR